MKGSKKKEACSSGNKSSEYSELVTNSPIKCLFDGDLYYRQTEKQQNFLLEDGSFASTNIYIIIYFSVNIGLAI